MNILNEEINVSLTINEAACITAAVKVVLRNRPPEADDESETVTALNSIIHKLNAETISQKLKEKYERRSN